MVKHYEKVIAACGFLFIFANVGLASTAFSVHQPFLVALDGIGDTGGSLILSVRTLVSLLVMLVVDRYYRLLDVRLGVSLASLFVCAGFLVYALAASAGAAGAGAAGAGAGAGAAGGFSMVLLVFMGGAVLLGFGYGLGGMVAMTYLANRWFAAGIGGVVGFASMGSGLASIVMPLVVVRVIEAFSLSTAFILEGCLAAAIGVVVFALLRNRPSDLGLSAYEGKGKGGRKAGRAARPRRELVVASKPERMLLMAAMVGVGVFSCCGITYLSVLATSSGFDTLFAATLVSAAGVALTLAKFAVGELFDHLGAPRASAIMFGSAAVGFALCCFAGTGSALVMVAGAIMVGAGLSLGTVGISVWSLELSDPASRSKQIKNFQVAYALGGFIANTLPGIVKDLVGSYVVSYAAMVVVIAFSAFVVLRFYRKFTQYPADLA